MIRIGVVISKKSLVVMVEKINVNIVVKCIIGSFEIQRT